MKFPKFRMGKGGIYLCSVLDCSGNREGGVLILVLAVSGKLCVNKFL